jgi:hypothetical protein
MRKVSFEFHFVHLSPVRSDKKMKSVVTSYLESGDVQNSWNIL